MKKLFFAALIAATVGASAFAADANKVSYRVKSSFETHFTNATNVSWHVTPEYTRFTFTVDNEKVEAFYGVDGEQLGVSRKVDFNKLPAAAIKKIQKSYPDYQVSESIEFDRSGETNYYVSLAQGNKKKILEVSVYGGVSIYYPASK